MVVYARLHNVRTKAVLGRVGLGMRPEEDLAPNLKGLPSLVKPTP